MLKKASFISFFFEQKEGLNLGSSFATH